MAEHSYIKNWRDNWKFHTSLIVLTWLFCIFAACSTFLSYYFKAANATFKQRITALETLSGENLADEHNVYSTHVKTITQHFNQSQLLFLILIVVITGGMILYFWKKRNAQHAKDSRDNFSVKLYARAFFDFAGPVLIASVIAVAVVFLMQDYFIKELQQLGASMLSSAQADNSMVASALQGATKSSADFLSQYSTRNFFQFNLQLTSANFEFVLIGSYLKELALVLGWLIVAFSSLFVWYHRPQLRRKKQAEMKNIPH